MSNLPFDPLLLAIAAPFTVAVLIALGLPKRLVTKLAYAGFAVPALVALWAWWSFGAAAKEAHGYAFVTHYSTGLDGYGVGLKLGLNGIALPLFVLAGVVGLAAGLYALQSGAERMKTYLLLLLVMQTGLLGTFASVDVFFFYFFHELALIPTFIMVGIWGGRDRTYAAMMMTIYLTVGAMLSLLGLIAIYAKSGASSFDLMTLRDTLGADPEAHLRPPPLRLRDPGVALAVPLLGAPRLRGGPELGGDAPCRRAEEVRALRPGPDRPPAAPARRAPLEPPGGRPGRDR
jgi:NADH-quinone oxidoreductase subunit M